MIAMRTFRPDGTAHLSLPPEIITNTDQLAIPVFPRDLENDIGNENECYIAPTAYQRENAQVISDQSECLPDDEQGHIEDECDHISWDTIWETVTMRAY